MLVLLRAQMHDIVRDFTLASQADSGLEQLQRSFISTLVSGVSSKPSGTAAQATVSAYAANSLGHHLRGVLSPPFAIDALAMVLDVSLYFYHQLLQNNFLAVPMAVMH